MRHGAEVNGRQRRTGQQAIPVRGATRGPDGGDGKDQFGNWRRNIVKRTAMFADRIVKLSFALPNNAAGWEIGRQLVRAGMSVGANVEEAQGGESKADFLHKMRIARKECRETRYFLKRVANGNLIATSRLERITDEADQLVRILTAIIVSSEK
jgi:four helix bundle protein